MPQLGYSIIKQPAVPLPGSTVIVAGDSIGDTAPWNALAPLTNSVTGYGQWVTALCAAQGWVRLNQNMIPNGNFETDCNAAQSGNSGFGYQPTACSLARVAYSAGTIPAYGNTGNCLRATAVGAGLQVGVGATTGTSYNGLNGTDALTGTKVRLFLQASTTYTLSCLAAHPVGNSASSNPRLVFAYNTGGGYVFATSSQTVTKGVGSMTLISVTFTTPAAAMTDTQIYIDLSTNVSGDILYVDNLQLEVNGTGAAYGSPTYPTAFSDYAWRGSISNSWLASHGNTFGYSANLQDTAGNRITTNTTTSATWGANVVIVAAGVNDIQNVGAATHPMTIATWTSGMDTILSYLNGLSPRPYIIVGGIANSVRQPSPVPTTPFYASLDDLVYQMDSITRQLASKYNALFVRARTVPPLALMDIGQLGSVGVHPTPDGARYLASRYVDAIHRGS